jgi:hypothetical protein
MGAGGNRKDINIEKIRRMMQMRTRMASKEELAGRLLKKFGHDVPIFTSEIIGAWKEYSRSRVFQLLNELLKDGTIVKNRSGIYYFPTTRVTGKRSTLDHEKIVDKKYVYHGEMTFGYYSGISLLNGLHLTTQMPFHTELVTSKASTPVRKIWHGRASVTVRRSKVPISNKNVHALMLLEAFTEIRRPLDEEETEYMREFVELKKIKKEDVLRYAKHFPAHALNSLLGTGIKNVFA